MSGSHELERNAAPSDAGPVAARQGFKYQDHVAAFFVLLMIDDERLQCVECETADDIVLRWKDNSTEATEYVQVKTTEEDKKWTQAEILSRDTKGRPTSLAEKSLLCDKEGKTPLFRIVSRRDVNRGLACLKLDRDVRARQVLTSELGAKLKKKWDTVSSGGKDLAYWAENTVWQVSADVESLAAVNCQKITILAERFGANPIASHVRTIYRDLLEKVDEAARGSSVAAPASKLLTRPALMDWWRTRTDETEAARLATAKPYRAKAEAFLAELHALTEGDIRRALSGFDVRYENKKWRSEQLAEHLFDWLPELALKPSDLVLVQHLKLREKTRDALQAIKRHRHVTPEQLLGETLLHVVVRQAMKSEPIACKIFYQSPTTLKAFANAHIVHSEGSDELWLGRATVAEAETYDQVVSHALAELRAVLDTDFIKAERDVILTLREPKHLMPTTLETALSKGTPIDDLISALCIPVLIAYDSKVLSAGFAEDYREKLVREIAEAYVRLKALLPTDLKPVKVHIFLVPIESVDTLKLQFEAMLTGQ